MRDIKAFVPHLGIVLLATALAVGAGYFVARQRREQEAMIVRDVIGEHLRAILPNRSVLKMAAVMPQAPDGNAELARCLLGGRCRATSSGKPTPFALRQGLDAAAPMLAGTDEDPANYGRDGTIGCRVGQDPGCPGWQVRAWFWAECPDDAAECDHPRGIHVIHQVRGAGDLAGLPPSPSDEVIRDPGRSGTIVTGLAP